MYLSRGTDHGVCGVSRIVVHVGSAISRNGREKSGPSRTYRFPYHSVVLVIYRSVGELIRCILHANGAFSMYDEPD